MTSRGLYDTVVTIGFENDDATTFTVHRGLICHHSSFFRTALQGRFSEGQEKKVTLPAEEKEPFRVFMGWMYRMQLFDADVRFSLADYKTTSCAIEAYVFAIKRGIPCLKNAIVDLFVTTQIKERILPISVFQRLWSATPTDDGLRKLTVDWCVFFSLKDTVFDGESCSRWPKELLFKVLSRVILPAKRPEFRSSDDWTRLKCDYHDHADICKEVKEENNVVEAKSE